MKNLIETSEVKKFQNIARKVYSETKVIDLDAVQIGWKLHNGSVIVDAAKGLEIEITGDIPTLDNPVSVRTTMNGTVKDGHTLKSKLAWIILTQPVEVYYSR